MADQENPSQTQKRPQGKKKAAAAKKQGKKAPAQESSSGGGSQTQVLRVIDTNAVPHETARPDTPISEADRPNAQKKQLDKENQGVVSLPAQMDRLITLTDWR